MNPGIESETLEYKKPLEKSRCMGVQSAEAFDFNGIGRSFFPRRVVTIRECSSSSVGACNNSDLPFQNESITLMAFKISVTWVTGMISIPSLTSCATSVRS